MIDEKEARILSNIFGQSVDSIRNDNEKHKEIYELFTQFVKDFNRLCKDKKLSAKNAEILLGTHISSLLFSVDDDLSRVHIIDMVLMSQIIGPQKMEEFKKFEDGADGQGSEQDT